jgi:hypothetical protein
VTGGSSVTRRWVGQLLGSGHRDRRDVAAGISPAAAPDRWADGLSSNCWQWYRTLGSFPSGVLHALNPAVRSYALKPAANIRSAEAPGIDEEQQIVNCVGVYAVWGCTSVAGASGPCTASRGCRSRPFVVVHAMCLAAGSA